MSRFRFFITLCISVVTFAACISVSATNKFVAEVNGILLNFYGEPLAGVEIKLGDQVQTTSAHGEFTLTHVLDGEQTIGIFPEDDPYHSEQTIFVGSGAGLHTIYAKDDHNPVENPGFEFLEAGEPVGWGTYIPKSNGVEVGHVAGFNVSFDAWSGEVALVLDVDAALEQREDLSTIRQAWTQKLPLEGEDWIEGGAMYTLSFDYKTTGDPKLRIGIERRLQELNESGNPKTDNSYATFDDSESWTSAEFDFKWPHPDTHTDSGVTLLFFTQYGVSGKIWIDHVKILKSE